jgi:hypothetical protein
MAFLSRLLALYFLGYAIFSVTCPRWGNQEEKRSSLVDYDNGFAAHRGSATGANWGRAKLSHNE